MKTYERIYKLLQNTPEVISGEDLAKQLSISRTSIWKAMQTLENKGLTIQSIKKRGYKLISGDLYLVDELEKTLAMPIYFKPKTSSTQLDAKYGAEAIHMSPALYLAETQSAGKGRFGRSFFCSQTGGIYMTLRLEPNSNYQAFKPYTIMAASSLVKAISRLTGIECDIKWVNDIYLNGKKIAGILTEASSSVETGLVSHVFIGVGVNFFITAFPEELNGKAGSLFHDNPLITRQALITEMWQIFQNTPEKDLIRYYKEKSLVLHQHITYLENGLEQTAYVDDITERGELKIISNQKTKVLSSGEIKLLSWTVDKK